MCIHVYNNLYQYIYMYMSNLFFCNLIEHFLNDSSLVAIGDIFSVNFETVGESLAPPRL